MFDDVESIRDSWINDQGKPRGKVVNESLHNEAAVLSMNASFYETRCNYLLH